MPYIPAAYKLTFENKLKKSGVNFIRKNLWKI